jgi:hypothetical protein
MNTEELSPEQELVQDLITITHGFSSRLYGLRTYRKALKKAIADDQSSQDQAPSNACTSELLCSCCWDCSFDV